MEIKRFTGVITAILTVYDEDLNVKKDTVKKLVDYQLQNGASGFYVCGNTGECTVLPAKTRKQMLEVVIESGEGRGDIIAHIGAGHLDETLDLLDHANKVGVDAVASLPPSLTSYYNMNETIDYYRMLAERSKAPVIAYITGVLNGDPVEFAKRVSDIPGVSGIKLTIPNYYNFARVVAETGSRLNILNGPDETMLCGLSLGADGAIGTTYNFVPKLARGIYDAYMSGDMLAAKERQHTLIVLISKLLGRRRGFWKAIMETMGFDMGHNVFPATPYTKDEISALEAELRAYGFYELI